MNNMNMRSILRSVPLFLCLALLVPQGLGAQSLGQLKNLQKSILEMQLEMQEYQDELQEQFSGQRKHAVWLFAPLFGLK